MAVFDVERISTRRRCHYGRRHMRLGHASSHDRRKFLPIFAVRPHLRSVRRVSVCDSVSVCEIVCVCPCLCARACCEHNSGVQSLLATRGVDALTWHAKYVVLCTVKLAGERPPPVICAALLKPHLSKAALLGNFHTLCPPGHVNVSTSPAFTASVRFAALRNPATQLMATLFEAAGALVAPGPGQALQPCGHEEKPPAFVVALNPAAMSRRCAAPARPVQEHVSTHTRR